MMHFASDGWKLDYRIGQNEGSSRDPQGASGVQDGGTRRPSSRGLQGMEEGRRGGRGLRFDSASLRSSGELVNMRLYAAAHVIPFMYMRP